MKDLLVKSRNTLVLRGVLSIILGISIFIFPVGAALIIAMTMGIAVIMFGTFAAISAFSVRSSSPDWWVLFVEGLLSLALGFMIVAWPLSAILVLIIWIAFWMMFIGLISIYQAIKLRKQIQGEAWYIASGAFAFITGILMLTLPVQAGGAALYFIASLIIVYGVMMFVIAFRFNKWKHEVDNERM